MGVTISGSGTISSGSGNISFDDDNVTTTGSVTGSVAASQLTGAIPALDGSAITGLNASNISSGTVPVARLGSGASATKFLRGDGTFQEAGGVTEKIMEVSAVESDNADFLTFEPSTGWFDGTYTSMWLEGEFIRPSVNDRYLLYQLGYLDASGAQQYRTSYTAYRHTFTIRQQTGEEHNHHTFNAIMGTSQSQYLLDTLATNKIFGRIWIDLSWFCTSTIAGQDKTVSGCHPVLWYKHDFGSNNNDLYLMWQEGVAHHMSGLAEVDATATKWNGIRFLMSSSAKISGLMRLWGRKE